MEKHSIKIQLKLDAMIIYHQLCSTKSG